MRVPALVLSLALWGCQPGFIGGDLGDQPPGGRGDGDEPPLRLMDGGAGGEPPPPGVDAGPGGGGGGGGGDTPPGDACGDVRSTSRVYHGTTEPTYLDLSPGQVLSIGMMDMGGGLCSGMVIAPRWFLTAAHCTSGASPSGTTIRLGADPARPEYAIRAASFDNAPGADIALVELSEDATVAAPGLVPVPVITEDMDSSWTGKQTEASGYGRTERGSVGTRYFSNLPIDRLTSSQIHIEGGGSGGVCNGDSGGPIMARASDGSIRVIGVVSGGDGTCTYSAYFTRADVNRSWIESNTGPIEPPGPPPCGDITTVGRCMDGQAVWCGAGDELQSETCPSGTTCGWDDGAGGYRCIASDEDSCGGLDAHGSCDGNVARWCDRGVPRSRDCGACDQTCGVVAEHDGVYCTTDPCAGLDYHGRCNGDVAEWCDEGEFKTKDCAAEGKRCRWISEELGYYCG